MQQKSSLFVLVLFLSMLITSPAFSQTESVVDSNLQVSVQADATESSQLNVDSEQKIIISEEELTRLDGVQAEEQEKAPKGFGLLWRNIKEKFTLAITFDPVKEAEKRIQFAEERLQMAQQLAIEVQQTNDPRQQEKVERMLDKAREMMERAVEKRDEIAQKSPEEAKVMVKNIVAHELRRERIMNTIEQQLPEERQHEFREKREQMAQQSTSLLTALENENLPEDVRAHLQAVKERIDAHATRVKEFNEKRKELQEKARQGDEQAIEELKQLREERKEAIKQPIEQFRLNMEARKEMRINDRGEEGTEVRQ